MTHYIIVKFNENTEKDKIIKPIIELFNKATAIQGMNNINIFESNMDLPNRYDLMIKMDLTQEALKEFDNGEIHKKWKENFGKYIMSKTIFDCE